MSEPFLLVEEEERSGAYRAAARQTGLPTKILEKDVWICWTLEVLYGQPGHYPMAFKGGTSLSKVFNAISRFSEDIDITITLPSHDPDSIPASGAQRKNLTKKVAVDLDAYLESTVVPLLVDALGDYSADPSGHVTKTDRETVVLDYPSCYEKEGGYLTERVKIEFGARNQVTPSESHTVTPYVGTVLEQAEVSLPTPLVDVLSGERTFWEKATLAHDECNRADLSRGSADRISRHWYDLAMLADHRIGASALEDRELLAQVVTVKKAFFARSSSHYDDCLSGAIRLVPDTDGISALRADYEAMIVAGMFRGEPPTFNAILDRVRTLEGVINAGWVSA
ncbi:MAG: nucleotidyl transferase AbiEii/AbiGii toxin family protein [Acidimicrobiales bacterium]